MMTIRTVIVLSLIFLILLANVIYVSSFLYVAGVFLSAFAFIFFMVHFFNIFLKVFDFYLNKKKIKKENKKLYSDLSNWQDIPEFESKEDIELYLKNKIEKDILEEEEENKNKLLEQKERKYFSNELAKFIYLHGGANQCQSYMDHWAYLDFSHYEKDFKYEKNKQNYPSSNNEKHMNLISSINQELKDIDEIDNKYSSGGQRKTRFFDSEIMKKANEISRKDIEDYNKTYLREKFLGE